MQERDETTYQCRPDHLQTLEHLAMEILGRAVDTEEPQSALETSVEREKWKSPTLDALTRHDQCGGFKTESDGRRTLLLSARVRASANEEWKTMDLVRGGETRVWVQVGAGADIALTWSCWRCER